MKDFQEFIMKGNVIDLAVAVVIEDIIHPVILNPAIQAAGVKDLALLQIK
jgi:large conductance mechanosensitive channel